MRNHFRAFRGIARSTRRHNICDELASAFAQGHVMISSGSFSRKTPLTISALPARLSEEFKPFCLAVMADCISLSGTTQRIAMSRVLEVKNRIRLAPLSLPVAIVLAHLFAIPCVPFVLSFVGASPVRSEPSACFFLVVFGVSPIRASLGAFDLARMLESIFGLIAAGIGTIFLGVAFIRCSMLSQVPFAIVLSPFVSRTLCENWVLTSPCADPKSLPYFRVHL